MCRVWNRCTRYPRRLNRWKPWALGLMLVAAMAFSLAGCGEKPVQPSVSEAVAHRYELHGIVIAVDAPGRKATIKHEKIADLMDAMQMSFSVPGAADLEQLEPGKVIEATLVVENSMMWLEHVKVTGEASPEGGAAVGHDH